MAEIPEKYTIDNAKNDIQNLQDQNSYDFQEIKRLDGLIKEYDKRVLQAINYNNQINEKIQDDYEKFKKSIIDDNLNLGNGGSSGSSESIRIVDNLNSTSTTSALSANQGRVIKSSLDDINTRVDNISTESIRIVDNLNSTSTTSALSANQGRVIKSSLDDINTRVDNVNTRIDNLNLGNGGSSGSSESIRIVDNLNSTSTTSALSANQGRVIKSSLDTITAKVDNIIINNEGGLNFDDLIVNEVIKSDVDENIIKQEYLGGYIEVQPDSWDGSTPVTGYESDNKWGFPFSLNPSEREKIKKEILNGENTNIRYIRFPLGFAYRGYRNIDEASGLAKNIGERFKGQNATLKKWFENISNAGGGLAAEYWCPPVYWLTSGSYNGDNQISAGGNYPRSTTLSSIKSSDLTQYNTQIQAFTDAIINDLEYLHQNIAPIRMFALQNEPNYTNLPYGSCKYDAQTYNDVLGVLYPKIRNSSVLSEYNDEENNVKLLVSSSDEEDPFKGVAKTYLDNNFKNIWGFTFHKFDISDMNKQYNYIKSIGGTNIFSNEYEYFKADNLSENTRFANNVYRMINEQINGESMVLHPVIHICKPIGQTSKMTYSEGYCLYLSNLKGEYGALPSDNNNTYNLAKGTTIHNPWSYNSWQMFGQNLPINSYLVGDYSKVNNNCAWVTYKYENRLYIFMVNTGESWARNLRLTFTKRKKFNGKLYDINSCGITLDSKIGDTIDFIIPPTSGLVWVEDENYKDNGIIEEIECSNVSLSDSNLIFNNLSSKNLTYTLTPSNTTDSLTWEVEPPGIVNINNGVISPIKEGECIIKLTCGNQTATCNVKVELPTLKSISATFTQENFVIYPTTNLNRLKDKLIVIATYTDNSTEEVVNYELSGKLTVGESIITVNYLNLTSTFKVIVSENINDNVGYVNENLIAYFDCRGDETGNWNFNDDKTIWYDLSGNNRNINTEYKPGEGENVANEYGLKGTSAVTQRTMDISLDLLKPPISMETVIVMGGVSNILGCIKDKDKSEETSTFAIGSKVAIPYGSLDVSKRHHLAFTLDDTNVKIYIDGSIYRSYNNCTLQPQNIIKLDVLKTLSVFRIYDKVLTQTEITKNYNSCKDIL